MKTFLFLDDWMLSLDLLNRRTPDNKLQKTRSKKSLELSS